MQEDSDTAKYIHRIGQLNLHFYQSKSANLRYVVFSVDVKTNFILLIL